MGEETNIEKVAPKEFSCINNLITVSSKFDLTVECIWSAMRYLQDQEHATIEDACNYGLNEWIK